MRGCILKRLREPRYKDEIDRDISFFRTWVVIRSSIALNLYLQKFSKSDIDSVMYGLYQENKKKDYEKILEWQWMFIDLLKKFMRKL